MKYFIIACLFFSSIANAGQVTITENFKIAGKVITNFTNFKALVCTADLASTCVSGGISYQVPTGKQFRVVAAIANSASDTFEEPVSLGFFSSQLDEVASAAGTVLGPFAINTLPAKFIEVKGTSNNNPRAEIIMDWIIPQNERPWLLGGGALFPDGYMTTVILYGYEETP